MTELKNILIIGPRKGHGYHFSERMHKAFKKLGYDTKYLCPEDFMKNKSAYDLLKAKKHRKGLFSVLLEFPFDPQLIIIDECQFFWNNDLNAIPVIYHQREFKRPPTVFYPNVVLMWHEGLLENFRRILEPEWMNNVPYHKVINISVDPEVFKPKEKQYKGVIGIGYRELVNPYTHPELANCGSIKILYQEELEFLKLDYTYFSTPISNKEYQDIMPKCETLWIALAIRQLTSHRMLEAMACKTLCFIKLESEEHEKALENLGLLNMVHYIGTDTLAEFQQAYDETSDIEKQQIVNNAYDVVMDSLTDIHCAESVIRLYEEIKAESNKKN